MLYGVTFTVSKEEIGIFYALFELFRGGITLMNKQITDDDSTYFFSLCMFEDSLNEEEKLVICALRKIFYYKETSMHVSKTE